MTDNTPQMTHKNMSERAFLEVNLYLQKSRCLLSQNESVQ